MITTLGDLLDDSNDSAFVEHVDKASRLMNGYNFDDCEVRSRDSMGIAAGLWETGPEQMAVREDMVDTVQGQCMVTHVLVHEALHATGLELEGFTEAQASWLTHEAPIAYHSEVRAAQDFFLVVGRERSIELAQEDKAEIGLLAAYISERVQRNIPALTAAKEGQELLEKARGDHA
jgi:hypothetical protein